MNAPWWLGAYLKILLAAAVVTLLTTPMIKWIAVRVGAIDIPSMIKVHVKPTPRLGGVAIYLGFIVSIFLNPSNISGQQWAVLIGATLALLVGIFDDIKPVPATIKLIVLFAITCLLASKGVMLRLVPGVDAINSVLTLFWIVGVTSAFNAMDNMDGLATGLTFFASLAYAYVSVQNHSFQWGGVAVALMGSCLGFLFHNFPPAKIFMGDSGSFFLGYTLAVTSVVGEWSSNPFKAIVIPVFILGLPIFDLMYVVFRRKTQGITKSIRQIITFSAKDHFSHRLLDLGMSQKRTLLFTYCTMLAMGMGAVAMRYVHKVEAIILTIQVAIIAFSIVILMEYALENRRKK